ncbi:MAG TPA: hypothetical protein VK974_11615 [Methylophilaceae bacterium]|nr:hypothetical protein [Methylophilaceae bacterium]
MPTQFPWIFPAVAIALLVFYLIYDQRKVRLKRQAKDVLEEASRARQDIVLNELNFLGNLIDDTSLSASELQEKAAASIATLDANNVDGRFTETINDIKQYVASKTHDKQAD